MPGIAGIISRGPREKNERDLSLMIGCMMHESFYEKCSYINDQLGIYASWVGHRGSFSDCMPIVNEKEDVILLFSGESFVDKSVVEQLKSHGHVFDSSKADYLAHLYEEEGESFLRHLNGRFSGLLIDLRKASVVLFNDRYGMHRVYYYEGKDAFLFSSEAKSLLKARPELRQIDVESLGELVNCNCVLQNRTLFSKIFLLPGSAAWTWQNRNSIQKNYYFNPRDWEQQAPLEKEDFYTRLKETFLKILPRYFRAEEQIGLSLSGGLDTRMVIAGLNPLPGQFPCYTFGSMRDMLDIRIARKVADACHQTHHTIRLDHRFFSEFSSLAERTIYITDGYLDVCNSHDIYFNRLVREIAPIRMSGKFGSEIIRDHTMFNGGSGYSRIFHPDFGKYVQKSLDTLAEMKKGHKLSVALFKDFPWREYGKLAMEQSQLTLRTPYMDNELVEVMYQAPAGIRSSNEVQRRIIGECNLALSRIMTDRGFFSESNYLFSKLIELYYYSLFKIDYVYLFALPHWLTKLDSMFASINREKQILGYQKFEYYRVWFRNQLSNYIKEILLDKRTISRPYFDKASVEKLVREHIKGSRNYLNEINQAITIELINRTLIDT